MTTSKRPGGNSVWPIRPLGTYPQIYVRADGELVNIVIVNRGEEEGWSLAISRRDARLLARRINQCLDATVKGRRIRNDN